VADPNTRQGKRTPVTLKIKFKSETLEQFIERYAVDVSQGGIFIRTKEPLAVGTQMRFEFQLRDASPLIAGEGTVVWTRENDPSRPAIAPGMGVRFDRLADGSQSVLERILAEKAKQQPQRQQPETTRPPLFTDTPTRVAPAPVQEALLGDRAFSDQQTPLPKPMPFHSDADEFPEEAFEEATKVRALDELIAQSAAAEPATIHARRDDLIAKTAERTKEQEAVAPLQEPAERESAPVLPSPPEAPRTATGDRAAAAAAAVVATPALAAGGEAGRTRLGLEPARVETAPRMSAQMPTSATSSGSMPSTPVLTPKDKAKEAEREKTAAREKSATAKEAPRPMAPANAKKSAAPLVILILLLLGAGGAAVWFFVLREKVADQVAENPKVAVDAPTVAASPDAASPAVIADAGSAGAVVENGSGGTIVDAGSGSGSAGSASVAPGVPTVDTVITASAKGATVSVAGLSGPAPFTAKLEKDKEYEAQITAVGHLPLTVTVKGGGPRVTAKLTPKPYVITVNSTPPGALVYVDGRATGHSTPYDVTLEKAQAAKKSVKITLQKAGFRVGSSVVSQTVYSEGAEMMTTTVDITLATAPVRPPPDRPDPPDEDPDEGSAGSAAKPPDTGSATKPPDTGSATKPPDTGSATKPPDTGSATKPTGSGSGSATKPTGSGSGSAKEPEPGFMNRE